MNDSHLSSSGFDFFDVDHTVIRGSTSVQFLVTGIRLGLISSRIILSVPQFYWQYYISKMDFRKAQQSLQGFKNIREEDISRISAINFQKKIRKMIIPGVEQIIRKLISSGRSVIFITSSFHHVVQPLAEYLGVRHALANSLVYEDGISTGAFQEPFLFGEEKKHQALSFLNEHNISPKACSFYTDSIHDLALLEAVGKPVAVNPDRKLRKAAQDRGWQILTLNS